VKQWYALRSKPKQEATAGTLLAQRDIEIYLPMVTDHRLPGKRPAPTPFFPGYLFARLDPDMGETHLARFTCGVLQLVSYGDEPCPVPDDLIDLIRIRVDRLSRRGWASEFQRGDRVVITGGPFSGVEAVFEEQLSSTGRVQVLVQVLRRLCRADVHVGQLRLATRTVGRQAA
jgi:transcriptional antiterminator RfaH